MKTNKRILSPVSGYLCYSRNSYSWLVLIGTQKSKKIEVQVGSLRESWETGGNYG